MAVFLPLRNHLVAVCLLCVTAGCGSPPKPPPIPPTVVQVTLTVGDNANPDPKERASPIIIRFMELKSLAAFERSDFFSLFDRDKETLAADLVVGEELTLAPGAEQKFERVLKPETRYLAVVAAFRDLERATWRASLAIPEQQVTPVAIRIESRAVSITSARK